MNELPPTRFEFALRWWSRLVTKRAGPVVALVLAGAAGLGWYAATHIGIDTATEGMVAHAESYQANRDRYRAAFPDGGNELLVVVEAGTPEGARLAAATLSGHFESMPELFEEVEWVGGGPFFQKHQLLYLEIAELEDLTNVLAQNQPLMARLAAKPNLATLFDTLTLALENDSEITLELDPVFERLTRAVEAGHTGRFDPVSWTKLMSGRGVEEEARRQLLVLNLRLDANEWLGAGPAIDAVRRAASELGLAAQHGASVQLTGDVALAHDERQTLKRDGVRVGLASLLLVGIVLGVGLRSLRMILASLVTLVVGLVLTAAFATAAVGDLNMISVAFAALYIGIGIDYAIHLCLRVRELQRSGLGRTAAIEEAVADLGRTLLICTLSTLIGFFAFIPTAYKGVSQLGLIAGGGMVISFAVSLTLLPALLQLLPGSVRGPSGFAIRPWLQTLAGVPERHRNVLRIVALAAALGALAAWPRVHFDFNPLNLRDPESESLRALVSMESDPRITFQAVHVLADSAAAEEELARRLGERPDLGLVRSFADLVPENQEEKLQVLDQLALTLGPETLVVKEGASAVSTDEQQRAMRDCAAALRGDSISPAGKALGAEIEAFLASLGEGPATRPGERLEHLRRMLLGTFPEALSQLDAGLEADLITPELLPAWLRASWIGTGGERRVEIRPEVPITDSRALAAFVDRIEEVVPNAVGAPVWERTIGAAVTKSFLQAVLMAIGAIAVLLVVVFRNVLDTVRVIAVLALTGLLTAAITVPLGLSFNYANVIAIPLLLGLGVDTTIHLVQRWRSGGLSIPELLQTATARAVVISALTTMCSFGNLAFAGHRGMASMGQILFVGTLLMLWVNLQILPAFLGLRKDRGVG